MQLVQAHNPETVRELYFSVIENTPEIGKHARWEFGRHPTNEGIRSSIENGEMYLLTDLKKYAGGLTKLPVFVINTHGRTDHVPGNRWFDRAMMHL